MGLDELDAALNKNDEESLARWSQIARSAQMYSTPLFALSAKHQGDLLTLAGSGTFLAYNDSYYILTAAHVWYERLRHADKIGVTLREHYDHACFLDRNMLVLFGPEKPVSWNEWGPDLVLLRIPPARVGEINAFKVFYDLDAGLRFQAKGERTETYLLVGTPKALGEYKQNHASVELMGFWVGLPVPFDHEGRTYIDVKAAIPPPSDVTTFGGVSGGGLWRVQIFCDEVTGKIDQRAILEGVAFYEFNVSSGCGTIRCHGIASIREVLAAIVDAS